MDIERKLSRRLLYIINILICIIILSSLAFASDVGPGTDISGIGTVENSVTRELYPGIKWTFIDSINEVGTQKSHFIDMNYYESDIEVISSFGPYIYGGDSLGSIVRNVEELGYRVLFAVNGDSYDIPTGVPKGVMINDGILHHYSPAYKKTLGFTYDRSIVVGRADFNIIASSENSSISVTNLNRDRKIDDAAVYLHTDRFSEDTKSKVAGVEVVLEGDSAEDSYLRVGDTIHTEVISVNKVEAGETTAINSGQFVISAGTKSSYYDELSSLKPGQTMSITTSDKSNDVDWSNVKTAIGIYMTLMEDAANPNFYNTQDIHPRTSLMKMSDEQIQFMLNDGRNPEHAMGLKFSHMVDYSKSIGYPNLYNFDGGGSSTLYVNLPGYESSVLVNKPSDGRERTNANALVFVIPKEFGTDVDRLHIYGEEYGKSAELFIGDTITLSTKATDSQLNPVILNDGDISYTLEGMGSIGPDGIFYAGLKAGDTTITAVHNPSGISESFVVKTEGKITGIKYKNTRLNLGMNESVELEILGIAGEREVKIPNSLLTFEIVNDEVGSIDSEGIFTAGSTFATGELSVSYEGCSVNIPVRVGADACGIDRLYGENRFSTATAISSNYTDNRDTIILANAYNYPDALAGAPLADLHGSPVLLTNADGLPAETLSEINRLNVKNIIILGGINSINESVADKLRASGYNVERIAGSNRYKTAQLIAERVIKHHQGDTIFIASGENYPDALAVTPLTINLNSPILLNEGDELNTVVSDAIKNWKTQKVIIAGGPQTISKETEDKLKSLGVEVTRLYGTDRYETSVAITKYGFKDAKNIYITDGKGFVDALTAAPLAGKNDAAILLSFKNKVPDVVLDYLGEGNAKDITIIGGPSSISDEVMDVLCNYNN